MPLLKITLSISGLRFTFPTLFAILQIFPVGFSVTPTVKPLNLTLFSESGAGKGEWVGFLGFTL